MPVDPTPDEREALEELTAVWEEYDRTGDPAVIADHLAEDMMFLPPGESPVDGKTAVLDYLGEPEGDYNPDLDQWAEGIFVSGDLAVVHISVATIPDGGEESLGGGTKGLDVYRRDEDGEWTQFISIWNDRM